MGMHAYCSEGLCIKHDMQLKIRSGLTYKNHKDEPTDFQTGKESNGSPIYSASEMTMLGQLAKANLSLAQFSVYT